MKYSIYRTETADAGLRQIILYLVRNFGNEIALEKLNEIEARIHELADNPYIGIIPHYPLLRRKGHRFLILEKDLVIYRVDEAKKEIIIYAIVDQRQDYLDILRGL